MFAAFTSPSQLHFFNAIGHYSQGSSDTLQGRHTSAYIEAV
jgi:hypothetical protein